MWDDVIDDIDDLELLGKQMNDSMRRTLQALPEVSEKAEEASKNDIIDEASKESDDEDELLDQVEGLSVLGDVVSHRTSEGEEVKDTNYKRKDGATYDEKL
jgi:hypothetical protein